MVAVRCTGWLDRIPRLRHKIMAGCQGRSGRACGSKRVVGGIQSATNNLVGSEARVNTIAIIPARGGSKGIPRKNLISLCGKPLIAWTIEAALAASTIDAVYVSTDADDIMEAAIQYGAQGIWRPAEISGDCARSEDAILHALEVIGTPDITVMLQCTSPLVTADDIDQTVALAQSDYADCAFTVAPFHRFVWNADADGINHDHHHRARRQDAQPQYIETGAVYAMRTRGFQKQQHRFFGRRSMHVVPVDRAIEIDDWHDLIIAEALLRDRQRVQQVRFKPDAIVFDFDGVLTDNRVSIHEDSTEVVACNRSDGHAIAHLRANGIRVLVLSGEENPVVRTRCEKLGVECIQGVYDKLDILERWAAICGVPLDRTAYVGNDANDIHAMQAVGMSFAVADAWPDVKRIATHVLSRNGGAGIARELLDWIEVPERVTV